MNVVQPDDALDDSPRAIRYGLAPSKQAQKWDEATWERGPLVQRWRQWVRRQDSIETISSERTVTERRSETRGTTHTKDAITEDEATTTQKEDTTTDEPESTAQEVTTKGTSTQESSLSSTVLSTSTEMSSGSSFTTSSTVTSTEPGASCYSTTVKTSIVCSITTDGHTESASCITNRMTSSTCAPGLFCEIHPGSGVTVCMEQHNEIGTEGIIVGAFFGACIAGCIAVLVGMCLKDKRAQKRFQNIKRAKTLRKMNTATLEEEATLIAGSTN
ncbi:hypothetical protein ACKRZS_005974 [Fusarium odoratissimum]